MSGMKKRSFYSIKRSIRILISNIFGKQMTEKEIESILRYDVISFDMFDTLIFRKCSRPEEIFKIVEDSYNKNHADECITFVKTRIEAEKMARKRKGEGEVTLDEIYECMEAYPQRVTDEIKELEILTEMNNCIPNSEVVELYKRAVNAKKKVIVISDMYLPKRVVLDILNRCEINQKVNLFLSSELNQTKKEGSLYRTVLKELGEDPIRVIHIGDNLISDYFQAKRFGMDAFFYRGSCKA